MLDTRIYRAGWVPALFVLVLVAFSLRESPAPATSSLSAQAFDGRAALVLARGFARDPTAPAVARRLGAAGFRVRTLGSGPGRTVLAERTGFSSSRVVLLADRRSSSATAALLELGAVLGGRTLSRTLVLGSVAGSDAGSATAPLLGHLGGPVDAALLIGALGAGPERPPFVVPFSDGAELAPLGLRRTVESALRLETGRPPGASGLGEQLGRLALPLTLGGQGPLLDGGVPAVLVSSGGERGARARGPGDAATLDAFGRGILRAATALDHAPASAAPVRSFVLSGKVVPEWAVRVLSGALLLPLLLAFVDGFARVRRRRGAAERWLAWALAGALPFALCALLVRALGALGALRAAPTALTVPAGSRGLATLAGLLALLALTLLARRPLARRVLHLAVPADAAAGALGVLGVGLAGAVGLWLGNPYAGGLAALALHLWLLAVAPETRPRLAARVALLLLGALPFALLALGYARIFGLPPLGLAWTTVLALAGGVVPLSAALLWSLVAGALASALALALRAAPAPAGRHTGAGLPARSVRGPAGYAGPGSLGGTESALRR